MPNPKRLVLFVEGPGDVKAAPVLVKALLTELKAWEWVSLYPDAYKIGEYSELVAKDGAKWINRLKDAAKIRNIGGVLLLVDGDARPIKAKPFCAMEAAKNLAERARSSGAGTKFSVACVFACMEYESWLIGGIEALAGKPLPDGRPGIRQGMVAPVSNLEQEPRDAKGWLRRCMHSSYKPTIDQQQLTELLVKDLGPLRSRQLRSFRRLEHALDEVVRAVQSGKPIVSPSARDKLLPE